MPGTLRLLLAGLAGAALAWGALTAWTVSTHAAAAGDVVSASEPLSLDAQRMYQALSDADVTATTAFLAGRMNRWPPGSGSRPTSPRPPPS